MSWRPHADGFVDIAAVGLGHPIIGFDHFARWWSAASPPRRGAALVIGVLTMIAGVAVCAAPAYRRRNPGGAIGNGLGAMLLRSRPLPQGTTLSLFALVGLLHGYALGESIAGAEQTPLYAYLLGLAVIQIAIALAAMSVAQAIAKKSANLSPLRLVGAGIAGIGLAVLMQQVMPGA
jgi:urease accessory protein